MNNWSPTSWQNKISHQKIIYPDQASLQLVTEKLSTLPPLVTPLEIEALKKQIHKAANGEAFLLQGGDCAELFSDCRADIITNKLKILLQMSLVLLHSLRVPIIRVGRIAGQYAKPRTDDFETRNNITLPSYRGDLINLPGFSQEERTPNANLMLQGYQYSALTINYIRALLDGGFANIQHPEYWQLDFVKHSPFANEYQNIVNEITQAMHFMRSFESTANIPIYSEQFFISHEALNLYYESALTRQENQTDYYDLSTHFPWVGMRTSNIDGAHIEFMRGIKNPIAIKISHQTTRENLLDLLEILDPQNDPGKITLVVRLGIKHIEEKLPMLIETVKQTNKKVLWCCDPMHGNTLYTKNGIKTRYFDDIVKELLLSFEIHQNMNSYLGGLHIELTGDDVTECIGGTRGPTEAELPLAYESLIDPRLNYEQALELAMLVVKR